MVKTFNDHTIVTSTTRDAATEQYIALASVSWKSRDGSREFYVHDSSPVQYANSEEAEQAALFHAKIWIEQRLKF